MSQQKWHTRSGDMENNLSCSEHIFACLLSATFVMNFGGSEMTETHYVMSCLCEGELRPSGNWPFQMSKCPNSPSTLPHIWAEIELLWMSCVAECHTPATTHHPTTLLSCGSDCPTVLVELHLQLSLGSCSNWRDGPHWSSTMTCSSLCQCLPCNRTSPWHARQLYLRFQLSYYYPSIFFGTPLFAHWSHWYRQLLTPPLLADTVLLHSHSPWHTILPAL